MEQDAEQPTRDRLSEARDRLSALMDMQAALFEALAYTAEAIEPFRATSRSLSVIGCASKVGCPKAFLDGQGWPGAIVSGFIGVAK